MSVRIRLARMGRKNRPFYRVVVADSRSRRDGRFIEQIGTYDPLKKNENLDVKEDRVFHWLRYGANPSETMKRLFSKKGIMLKWHLENSNLSEDKKKQELQKWEIAQSQKGKKASKPAEKEEPEEKPEIKEKAAEKTEPEKTEKEETKETESKKRNSGSRKKEAKSEEIPAEEKTGTTPEKEEKPAEKEEKEQVKEKPAEAGEKKPEEPEKPEEKETKKETEKETEDQSEDKSSEEVKK
ncbi:MAG: 30S ribosomal protein S16 [Candidatus Marinimicrobia bacterium]|nr:30S ribosomal protein S16 [Candidatus Neomarinimicrobiota bacterium]